MNSLYLISVKGIFIRHFRRNCQEKGYLFQSKLINVLSCVVRYSLLSLTTSITPTSALSSSGIIFSGFHQRKNSFRRFFIVDPLFGFLRYMIITGRDAKFKRNEIMDC
jgi:hypothetical protein